jgi:transposase
MAKLAAAQDCCAKASGVLPVITLCFEVGYDAFWLARFLQARGIQCVVIDPGSLQVNRRGRPVKTDRVDFKVLLRTLIDGPSAADHAYQSAVDGTDYVQSSVKLL